jgi:hypothetical protein
MPVTAFRADAGRLTVIRLYGMFEADGRLAKPDPQAVAG